MRTALFCLALLAALAAGCATAPKRVTLVADGQRRILETQAATVDAFLQEAGVVLGPDDRIEPATYVPLDRNTTITIVRVQIKNETVTEAIPFERRTVRDESAPDGTTRLVQLGANGTARVTFQTISEDGQQTTRREISRQVVTPPTVEILAVGTHGTLATVPLQGTLVYLANGNAWVMRNRSDDKRPLTTTGDLDGRVFDLAPGGDLVLFTRAETSRLNSLWFENTVILGEAPQRLPPENVLYGQWNRAAGTRAMAYSTGERTPNAPGWKAYNDLWIGTLAPSLSAASLQTRQVLTASNPAPYSWWGTQYDWAPDGHVFGYALADQVGLIDVETGVRRVLQTFALYRTRADWVWTPSVSWSPDSRFLSAAVHAPPEGAGVLEDSQVFDVGVAARDNSLRLALAHDAGMWAAPVWSPTQANGESRLAYGQALNTADTERSKYALVLMDRDGSNRQRIFPPSGSDDGLDLIRVAWSSNGAQLAALRAGDVWLYDLASRTWSQLTANGTTRALAWK